MDGTDGNSQANTDSVSDADPVSCATQNNSHRPASGHRDSAAGDVTASRLSQRKLVLLKFKVYSAVIGRRPADITALLSGRHPADLKEVLQGSQPYSPKNVAFLTMAVQKANLNTSVRPLLEVGADVNFVDRTGTTALHAAIKDRFWYSMEMIKLLLNKGARTDLPNGEGMNCFVKVIIQNNAEIVKCFLDSGADPNQETFTQEAFSNTTRLHTCIACSGRHHILPATKTEDYNVTASKPVTALLYACEKNHLNTVKCLLESGARTDVTDLEGRNCLMVACSPYCNMGVVKLLLRKGMDPNYKSPSQRTPLHQAAVRNNTTLTELLLKRGAKLSTDSAGHTPLVDAIFHYCFDFAEVILSLSPFTRSERVEALELLAAAMIHRNAGRAYEYLHRAMVERHSDPSDVLLKPHRPPVPALGNVVESQTLEELESRSQDPDTLEWECLLAVERIMRPADNYVHKYFIDRCCLLHEKHRYDEVLALWTYMLRFLHVADSKTMTVILETLLTSSRPTFEQIIQALEAVVLAMEQGNQALATKSCFKCVSLALEGTTDEDQRKRLAVLIQRLIGAQSTRCQEVTMLHCAVLTLNELSVPMVTLLLQGGAQVNAATASGDTPLHYIVACRDRNQVETVCQIASTLLQAGADLDLRNRLNQTAGDCAVMEEVRALLQECYPLSLQCLAAVAVLQNRLPYQNGVPQLVQNFITMHKPGQQ